MTRQNQEPLLPFNAQLVQAPLQGLLRNTDCELARRFQRAAASRDRGAERTLSLFLILARFTKTSYESVSFLASNADDGSKRKKEFVLVVPPINRQLMDMLFNIVYITDDFPSRSLDYELYGYRQAREQYDRVYERFGNLPKWERHFEEQREFLKNMERYLSITDEQKASPSIIRYWVGPARLIKRKTKSQYFLKFLDTWFYSETSAQAHLNPAGLFSVAMFLISEFAPEAARENVEGRMLQQFTFKHFSRTLILVLAVLSEMESFCHLDNRDDLTRVWRILNEYSEEADDVYQARYQGLLTST
jgi:hypothetical protein